MKSEVIIIFMLIAIISFGAAYTYDEKIKVTGSGTLFTRTDTKNANDMVRGTGNQDYSRTLISDKESLVLESKYRYYRTNNQSPKYYYNKWDLDKNGHPKYSQIRAPIQYMLSMNNPGGLEQVVSFDGFCKDNCGNMTSNGTIKFNYPNLDDPNANSQSNAVTASSNFDISAAGNFSESLVDMKSGRPTVVAETGISNAHFTITSNLSGVKGFSVGDLSALLASLNNVNMSTEQGNKPFPVYRKGLDELNRMFDEKGGLDEGKYLSELRMMWKDGEITRDIALNEAKIRADKGTISASGYDSFKRYIDIGELESKSTRSQISKIDEYYNSTKDAATYNNSLKELYMSKEINDITYLTKIKDKVSPADYNSSRNWVNDREEKIYQAQVNLNSLNDQYNIDRNATAYLKSIKYIRQERLITKEEYMTLLEPESDKSAEFKKALDDAKKEISGR